MGRKKKEVKKEEPKPNVNIRDGNITAGNVKITAYKHGKKCNEIITHNTGTINLCDYIARALIGDYVIAERPYIIVPCSLDSDKHLVEIGNGTPAVASKMKVTAGSWDDYSDQDNPLATDGGYCAAVLTFNIPSQIVSGEEIGGFILKSKDNSRKKYAEVNFEDIVLRPEGDTNVRVEWTLYVSYKWDIDTTREV